MNTTHDEALAAIQSLLDTGDTDSWDLLREYVRQQRSSTTQLENVLRYGVEPESVRAARYIQAVANEAFMDLRGDVDEDSWPSLADYCEEMAANNWAFPESEEYASVSGFYRRQAQL